MNGPVSTILHGDARYLYITTTEECEHMRTGVELRVFQVLQYIGIFQFRSHEGNAVTVDDALTRECDIVGAICPKPEHAFATIVAKGAQVIDAFVRIGKQSASGFQMIIDVAFEFERTNEESLAGGK